jgi:hypothetical protein
MRTVSNKIVEKIRIQILRSKPFFFFEIRAVYDNVEKYGGVREGTDGNTAARCMVDK